MVSMLPISVQNVLSVYYLVGQTAFVINQVYLVIPFILFIGVARGRFTQAPSVFKLPSSVERNVSFC